MTFVFIDVANLHYTLGDLHLYLDSPTPRSGWSG
jgi:hypothetical protein